jgi:nucleoside 2-deoxyribosyltransferase
MVQAYLSGPIIHSHLRKDEFYRVVVDTLEARGIGVSAPQFLGPAQPEEIYRRDVDFVRNSDFIIAEVSNPSLGVGMELMLAILLKKPLIMFYDKNSDPLSKMVTGADGKALLEYSRLEEVAGMLRTIQFDALALQHCDNCGSDVAEMVSSKLSCIACGSSIDA